MRKYETVTRTTETLADITCDRCGGSCKQAHNYEYANITANWGYDSRKDEQVIDLDLCEDCFDILMEWVNGGSLRRGISSGGEQGNAT